MVEHQLLRMQYCMCTNVLGEEDNSGGNEDVPNETTSVADSPVRLMDSDPLAFHVLPSAVTADGE